MVGEECLPNDEFFNQDRHLQDTLLQSLIPITSEQNDVPRTALRMILGRQFAWSVHSNWLVHCF